MIPIVRVPPLDVRYDSLDDLYADYRGCTRCGLCQSAKGRIVRASGNPQASIMFVGEGPGANEHKDLKPFVGLSGTLLTTAIMKCWELIDRRLGEYLKDQTHPMVRQIIDDNIYITNATLCWPGDSGLKPTRNDYNCCRKRLLNEIYLVDPFLIVAFGEHAMYSLCGKSVAVSKAMGEFTKIVIPGRVAPYVRYAVLPCVHPAFVLRTGMQSEWVAKFTRVIERAFRALHWADAMVRWPDQDTKEENDARAVGGQDEPDAPDATGPGDDD